MLILILIFVLFVLVGHFFGPKQPPKPNFRPWTPEVNQLNKSLHRNREASWSEQETNQASTDQSQSEEATPKCLPGVIYDGLTHYHGGNGYPGDWDARKDKVKQRDGNRCQVTGCPNLESLDVHHIQMISKGGSHALDNLICLCIVHHWMLPDHELVSERQPEENMRRFKMRRAHVRYVNGNRIQVKATFERYVKCSVADCESIRDTYDLRCPICESSGVHFAIFGDDLVAGCLGCRSAWKMRRDLLAEEVGTLLGSIFKAWADVGGAFHFDLENLPDRHLEQTVLCKRCADFARIGIFEPIPAKPGKYERFWGCTNFRQHRCRNTLERQQR